MANAADWQNIAVEIREIMYDEAALAQRKAAVKHFYEKNAFSEGDHLAGLTSDAAVGDSGITKEQVIAFVTFAGDYAGFLDGGTVSQGDRRSTIEQLRATR